MAAGKRLYRVFYSVFDDSLHEQVKREIASKFGAEIVDHKSRVHPDFRFIEVLVEQPGLEDEIRDIVSNIIGSMHVKVVWIDTTK